MLGSLDASLCHSYSQYPTSTEKGRSAVTALFAATKSASILSRVNVHAADYTSKRRNNTVIQLLKKVFAPYAPANCYTP